MLQISGISSLALILNLNNTSTTILYAKKSIAGCKKRQIIYPFLVYWYKPTFSGQRESQCIGKLGFYSHLVLKLSAAPFCVAPEPVSTPTLALLYCCTLYNILFLDFVSGYLALTELQILTRPSDFHCLGELELWPWTALIHMCWAGIWAEILAIVEPQSWLTSRSVASYFPGFSKIQKKQGPRQRLF